VRLKVVFVKQLNYFLIRSAGCGKNEGAKSDIKLQKDMTQGLV
jgi:hypothetical protein